MSAVFKTWTYTFGVWKVKTAPTTMLHGHDTGARYWDTERAAWEHLQERASKELMDAEKNLQRARRNFAKVTAKLQTLP